MIKPITEPIALNDHTREISYGEAIGEALCQAMERDDRVFIMGIGVDDPKGIFGTTLTAYKKFGRERVFDTPVSENAMTGVAIGSCLAGLRPVMVHARNDFMYYCMDQIINHAAKWHYMFGGLMKVPLTIRAIIGRGWGQGAQHSQSLQAMFAHVPGLKVITPSTPYDVKGLLIASIEDDGPVIFLEHRSLYCHVGPVPEEPYSIPIGKGAVVREGTDATIVAISYSAVEASIAAVHLAKEDIDVEIVDPRSLKPLDEGAILNSVKKTGRLVIADTGWKICGVSAEIAALVSEKAFKYLKAPIQRVALPDVPTPTSYKLEKIFYPRPQEIIRAVYEVMGIEVGPEFIDAIQLIESSSKKQFVGPF
jgi:pyruvate dehydrogenase E1 component beta subunit